jgi:hypothetical protein
MTSKLHHSRHTIDIDGIPSFKYSRSPEKQSLSGLNHACFSSLFLYMYIDAISKFEQLVIISAVPVPLTPIPHTCTKM